MRCTYCGEERSKVTDSRDSGDAIRRRRECLECGRRYTTMERVQTRSMMVVKQDGRREEFDRDKLLASLIKACAKRPMPTGTVAKAADEIEHALGEMGRAEVRSEAVGELVMDRLRGMDRVAYIRYASVYRDFKDIDDFAAEVDALRRPPAAEPSPQLSFLDDEPPPRPVRRRRRPARRQPQPAS